MGRAAKPVLFTAILFAFFLLGLEGLVRATHLFGGRLSAADPHPVLAYRFAPGAAYWKLEENAHPVAGRYNAHGWRDRERTLEKPADTYRVAVLGDSQVEAANIELDSTFCAIAERALNRSGPGRYEILNFGRSGFTQTEELWLLENEVLHYSPDAVVVMFVPANDIADVRRETAPEHIRPFYVVGPDGGLELDTSFRLTRSYRMKRLINPLKRRSVLVSLVLQRYNAYSNARKKPPPMSGEDVDPEISGPLTLNTDHPDPRYEESFQHNRRLLGRIFQVCRDHGVAPALVSCNWFYRAPKLERLRGIDPSFDSLRQEGRLRALADSLEVPFIGLQEQFERHHADTGEALSWTHWNYAGQAFVAERLEELVRGMQADGLPRGGLESPRAVPGGS